MTKPTGRKPLFPTFGKMWDDFNTPRRRSFSRRIFWYALPLVLIFGTYVIVSGIIYQKAHR